MVDVETPGACAKLALNILFYSRRGAAAAAGRTIARYERALVRIDVKSVWQQSNQDGKVRERLVQTTARAMNVAAWTMVVVLAVTTVIGGDFHGTRLCCLAASHGLLSTSLDGPNAQW
jgi:hypothetical protein